MSAEVRFRVFETPLAWMGVVTQGGRLVRVLLSDRGRGDIERAVRREFPQAVAGAGGLLAQTEKQLRAYAAGRKRGRDSFFRKTSPDPFFGSDFARRVLAACAAIPAGAVRTYGQLAAAAGAPRAARAVGRVMSRNPLPIVIPCHRVVGGDGRLVGYSAPGGLALKAKLLAHEGATGWKP